MSVVTNPRNPRLRWTGCIDCDPTIEYFHVVGIVEFTRPRYGPKSIGWKLLRHVKRIQRAGNGQVTRSGRSADGL